MKSHKSKLEDFKIGAGVTNQNLPTELISFVEGLLFGHRKLDGTRSNEQKKLTETVTSSICYHIQTDRQVRHGKSRKSRARHKYAPQQTMALSLAVRHCGRNNTTHRLLSAPNFGFVVPPRNSLLLETMIANAMNEIVQVKGVYIPPNMKKGIRVSFHLDNYDELVETFDGKDTVHYLLIVGFQRSSGSHKPLQLTLKKTKSLKLDNSSFTDLLPCEEPSKRNFKRTSGCQDVNCSTRFTKSRSP